MTSTRKYPEYPRLEAPPSITEWTLLVDLDKNLEMFMGATFRFPWKKQKEPFVDYMMARGEQDFEYYFVVASGRYAGRGFDPITVKGCPINGGSLNAEWMVKNWKKYVYPLCEPEEVYYISYPPTPKYPPL